MRRNEGRDTNSNKNDRHIFEKRVHKNRYDGQLRISSICLKIITFEYSEKEVTNIENMVEKTVERNILGNDISKKIVKKQSKGRF